MLDLHTHILPYIDDGAEDLNTSLEMARIAVNDGITGLMATPHVIWPDLVNKKEDILAAVDLLQAELDKKKIPLQLFPGGEYHITSELPVLMGKGEILTMNQSQYLLLELPHSHIPQYTSHVIYELQIQKKIVIIAHPERNQVFIKHPERLGRLIDKGVYAQITAGSVTGLFGKQVKKTAIDFLARGWGNILASDAHSTRGRSPTLSGAVRILNQIFNEKFVNQLVEENPARIIKGDRLLTAQPDKKTLSARFLQGLKIGH